MEREHSEGQEDVCKGPPCHSRLTSPSLVVYTSLLMFSLQELTPHHLLELLFFSSSSGKEKKNAPHTR
jgi:hypothetical protein